MAIEGVEELTTQAAYPAMTGVKSLYAWAVQNAILQSLPKAHWWSRNRSQGTTEPYRQYGEETFVDRIHLGIEVYGRHRVDKDETLQNLVNAAIHHPEELGIELESNAIQEQFVNRELPNGSDAKQAIERLLRTSRVGPKVDNKNPQHDRNLLRLAYNLTTPEGASAIEGLMPKNERNQKLYETFVKLRHRGATHLQLSDNLEVIISTLNLEMTLPRHGQDALERIRNRAAGIGDSNGASSTDIVHLAVAVRGRAEKPSLYSHTKLEDEILLLAKAGGEVDTHWVRVAIELSNRDDDFAAQAQSKPEDATFHAFTESLSRLRPGTPAVFTNVPESDQAYAAAMKTTLRQVWDQRQANRQQLIGLMAYEMLRPSKQHAGRTGRPSTPPAAAVADRLSFLTDSAFATSAAKILNAYWENGNQNPEIMSQAVMGEPGALLHAAGIASAHENGIDTSNLTGEELFDVAQRAYGTVLNLTNYPFAPLLMGGSTEARELNDIAVYHQAQNTQGQEASDEFRLG
jgi:hypothetical protein